MDYIRHNPQDISKVPAGILPEEVAKLCRDFAASQNKEVTGALEKLSGKWAAELLIGYKIKLAKGQGRKIPSGYFGEVDGAPQAILARYRIEAERAEQENPAGQRAILTAVYDGEKEFLMSHLFKAWPQYAAGKKEPLLWVIRTKQLTYGVIYDDRNNVLYVEEPLIVAEYPDMHKVFSYV